MVQLQPKGKGFMSSVVFRSFEKHLVSHRFNECQAFCMEDREEESLLGPKFSPPLYQQRYDAVVDLVKKNNVKKVLDAGCSEGRLLTNIKIHCPNVEEIIGVDIDREILSLNKYRVKPLMAEYLFKRTTKLRMAVYQGSITEPDRTFENFDFIACVEVIEHLEKESLASFPAAMFGLLRPKIIAITTPNAEFNVLFENFTGFRHPDHKFEWTRAEFQSWCLTCSETYGYSVDFSCIGNGPKGAESLGGCSQMAIFKKLSEEKLNSCLLENVQTGSFELIADAIYPWQPELSTAEKLVKELKYIINCYFSSPSQDANNEDLSVREVPLEVIMEYHCIKSLGVDINMLRKAAREIYDLTDDGSKIVVKLPEYISYSEEFADETNDNESSTQEDDVVHLTMQRESEECWD